MVVWDVEFQYYHAHSKPKKTRESRFARMCQHNSRAFLLGEKVTSPITLKRFLLMFYEN